MLRTGGVFHLTFKMCVVPQRCALFPHLNFQKWCECGVRLPFWLPHVLRAPAPCAFSTSQRPKVVRDRQNLTLLTSKCASRHNGVHFFDISTSKSAPDLKPCLLILTSKCALCEHLTWQQCSKPEVLLTFWLPHVLRATTVCTFSTSHHPKVLWCWGAFSILTWECASRHSAVQFLISHPTRWLHTPLHRSYFSTLQSHKTTLEKHSVSRLFYFFAHLHLLSSDSFSSLIFFLLPFSLWLLSPLLLHLSISRKFDF